jgi:predicted DNA-binding transcriptional regulator AlpA
MTDQPPLPRLLTAAEVATLLRMSYKTLEKMRADGNGPPYFRLGGGPKSKVVYNLNEVLAWLEGRKG